MTKLALNHDQRHALMCHLDSVSVTQLVWRETAPDTSPAGCLVKLLPGG